MWDVMPFYENHLPIAYQGRTGLKRCWVAMTIPHFVVSYYVSLIESWILTNGITFTLSDSERTTQWRKMLLMVWIFSFWKKSIQRHTTRSKRKMSQVLQVLEISEIWICHIFEFCWMPKVTITIRKLQSENYDDENDNKVYIKINVSLYPLLHVRRRWYGS